MREILWERSDQNLSFFVYVEIFSSSHECKVRIWFDEIRDLSFKLRGRQRTEFNHLITVRSSIEFISNILFTALFEGLSFWRCNSFSNKYCCFSTFQSVRRSDLKKNSCNCRSLKIKSISIYCFWHFSRSANQIWKKGLTFSLRKSTIVI